MDIQARLQAHLDEMFEGAGAPKSRASFELREELLMNSLERYDDLTKGGMDPEAAYASVVDSIGNVDELLGMLPPEATYAPGRGFVTDEEQKEKRALTNTIAVGLYILAGVVFFAGGFLADAWWEPAGYIGLVTALVICIIPTCMLVYSHYSRPRYHKQEETMVEDFKRWNDSSKRRKGVFGALTSLLWTLTTLGYLVLGFLFGAWHPGWLIFVLAAVLESILGLLFKMSER